MPLTDEDKKEVATLLASALAGEDTAKQIGNAIRKIVPGMLTTSMEAATKPLTDGLAAITAKLTEQDEKQKAADDEASQKHKKGDPDPEVAKQLKKLSDELAVEKGKREKAEGETKAKEEQRRAGVTRSEFMRSIVELGVDPKLADIAYSHHAASLALADDGVSVTGKSKNAEGTEETQPLGDYLGGWLKSDVGKHFIKTDAAGGSGGGAGKKPGGGGAPTLNEVLDKVIAGGM